MSKISRKLNPLIIQICAGAKIGFFAGCCISLARSGMKKLMVYFGAAISNPELSLKLDFVAQHMLLMGLFGMIIGAIGGFWTQIRAHSTPIAPENEGDGLSVSKL